MNVALTRAKHSLWILGNMRTLQTNKNWEALVYDAKDRNLVLTLQKRYVSMFSSFKSNCASDDIPRHLKSKERGTEAVNRHTEQQRRINTSSKSKRGYPGAHNSDIGKAKKAKMQYRESSSANQVHEPENSGIKPATDGDCQGKKGGEKEKQRVDGNIGVDMRHDVRSRSVERPVDPICKRKQQREAVDALLPSAFISSRKPESSLRPVPNTTVHPSGHAIRQTKSRKG